MKMIAMLRGRVVMGHIWSFVPNLFTISGDLEFVAPRDDS